MKAPAPPANEAERLQRLEELAILDTLPEASYDDIVALAAQICGVPISLVSLVDQERQWFKARHGLDAPETPRDVSFCGHVVENDQALFVSDAHLDPRFADNPLVTGGPKVRFYAGAPLRTKEGLVLGTLCVIDHKPRELTVEQSASLSALSRVVVRHFELRLELKRRAALDEELRRISERRLIFERFFTNSIDPLCIAGMDGYFKELSPSWSRLLGYSLSELSARPFIEFVHPDDQQRTMAEVARLGVDGHQLVAFENRFRTKSGDYVWLLWTASAEPKLGLLLAAARDITDRKSALAALKAAKDAAEDADRSKSQFLATMSHELRTPLNAIIGFSKLLHKNKRGNMREQDLTYLERIRDNGHHLLGLINEVLDISKIEAGQMVYRSDACDASSAVTTVVRMQESLATAKSLTIEVDVPDGLCSFRADQHRLAQVLHNLVANAIKFTDAGKVTVRVVPRDDSLEVAAIEIVDTGIGIDADDLLRVFLPFEQADGKSTRAHAGTGLGLAISQSLCEGMGMALSATSVKGKGSVFRVSVPAELSEELPAVVGDLVQTDKPVTPGPRPRRVLVVDDNADARTLISHQLEELGCEVRPAQNGLEAIRIARTWLPEMITLDLMMPHANGWQMLGVLRNDEQLRNVPVVVISMIADEGRGTLCGALEVLRKPVSPEDLARILGDISGGKRRALVVDDSADARTIMAERLEDEGWEVAVATNGLEGYQAIAGFRPDAVFLDLMMPVMDGTEFLDKLRATPEYQDLPVVVVTAMDLTDAQRKSLLQKADGVVGKGEALSADLQRALNSEFPEALPSPQ